MTNAEKLSNLSVQDYLAHEEKAQVRHEFVNGRIFAMTGGSKAHNVISLNIATKLRSGLQGTGCTLI